MPFGVWVVAGVAVGALATGALIASGVLDDEAGAPTDPTGEVDGSGDAGDQAADEAEQRAQDAGDFLAAFERSRLGTFVVESTLQRTFPGGEGFTAESSVAQDPPDRLERSLGSVTARLGPEVTLCRVTEANRYRCTTGRAERSYRGLVADEVEALATYLGGDLPLYSVTADGDCFDLDQVRPLPAPPYGTSARFCFDDDTGALTLLRIERDEAVDVTEATSVTADVRAGDLRTPETGDRAPAQPDGGFLPNEDASTTTTESDGG